MINILEEYNSGSLGIKVTRNYKLQNKNSFTVFGAEYGLQNINHKCHVHLIEM